MQSAHVMEVRIVMTNPHFITKKKKPNNEALGRIKINQRVFDIILLNDRYAFKMLYQRDALLIDNYQIKIFKIQN